MKDGLNLIYIENDFAISDLDNQLWEQAEEENVTTYWSGQIAPDGRHFKARPLWSRSALYVRFEGRQDEPLVVTSHPELSKKTIGLWDRDVFEIFIAPDETKPNKYFEFEVAPTGEWIDLGIEALPDKRITDLDYASGMTSAARIEEGKVMSAIKVEWRALGKTPKTGDTWRGNLFRCIGKDPDRGYLAWQPTLTTLPNFHVPTAFGTFRFE